MTRSSTLFPWQELAGDCQDDPRIRFYVDRELSRSTDARQLADWTQVLAESSRDRTFQDASGLESYAEFASLAYDSTHARTDFNRFTERVSPAALLSFLTTRFTVALIVAVLALSWSEPALLACQLTAIALTPSAGLAIHGARAGHGWELVFVALFIGASTAVLTMPPVLGTPFPPDAVPLLGVLLGVVGILGLDHSGRPLLRKLKMNLLKPDAARLEYRTEDARQRWLEDATENVVMPELIQTINRLLQPELEKRLLVINTKGLRAIRHSSLLVPTRAAQRVEDALQRADGASIAISGPRGCGKTTLLRGLCVGESRFSVLVSAPTRYEPKEFLVELFQRLCTEYITSEGFSVEGRNRLRKRKSLLRYLGGATALIIRIVVALALVCLLVWSLTAELSHIMRAIGDTSGRGFDWLHNWSESWWTEHRLITQVALVTLIVLAFPKKNWRRLFWQPEPKLVTEARRHYLHLRAEQTATVQGGGGLPFLQAVFSRAVAHKTLPWTMPELVGHLGRFLDGLTRAELARERTVLICIDEVDRIGSVDEATRFLSEIKAVFDTADCHFVVAVAEELGAAFARRVITGRSIVENAFDEIISLEPMSYELSLQMLQRRVPGFTNSFVWLSLALSGGIPRELVRVARRLVEINIEFEYDLQLSELTDRMVREEIYEAISGTRSQIALLPAGPEWGEVLDRLRLLSWSFRPDAKLSDLRHALGELADLHHTQPSTDAPDEHLIKAAITELSAFAYLGMTICDAFSDDCFDLRGAHDPTSEPPDPYVEIAAARRELAVSAESCRTALTRIRLALSFP